MAVRTPLDPNTATPEQRARRFFEILLPIADEIVQEERAEKARKEAGTADDSTQDTNG